MSHLQCDKSEPVAGAYIGRAVSYKHSAARGDLRRRGNHLCVLLSHGLVLDFYVSAEHVCTGSWGRGCLLCIWLSSPVHAVLLHL
jgi:hypothetical protein